MSQSRHRPTDRLPPAHRRRAEPFKPSRPWEPWEVTALHEAAHAVVGDYLGLQPTCIRMFAETVSGQLESGGSVAYGPVDSEASGDFANPLVGFALVVGIFAGKAMEDLIGADPNPYHEALRVRLEGEEVKSDLGLVEDYLDRMRLASTEQREQMRASAMTAAVGIVWQEKLRIFALARALIEALNRGKQISGDDKLAWSIKCEGAELDALLGGDDDKLTLSALATITLGSGT